MASPFANNITAPNVSLRERGRVFSGESPRLSTPPIPRRRSSVLSLASDTRQSVQSSASDFILPLGTDTHKPVDDANHWHSSPLAFAILPAAVGLFFNNGSQFITDILILGLAGMFLNWALRLPWTWYASAQAVVQQQPRRLSQAIYDERDASPSPKSCKDSVHAQDTPEKEDKADKRKTEQEDAANTLRFYEKLAFVSTFVMPALGAYLLHVLRANLSRNSTAIISDYNLTIFLLVAEVRPCRQLVKLITARTLHLQRVANGGDFVPGKVTANPELETRLELLEAKVAEPTTAVGGGHKEDITALSVEVKKRYEPRIDALERALRRYEKRVTTLTMLTDQRLQALDQRLQDALSLAAVAAHSSQQPTVVSATMSYFARMVMMPVEAACFAAMLPLRMGEDALKLLLGGGKARKGSGRSAPDRGGKAPPRAKEKRPLTKEEAVAVPAQ